MKVTIIPEDIIIEFLLRKHITNSKLLSYCPDKIELSEDFLEKYIHIIKVIVQRELVKRFSFKEIYFVEDDITRKYTVADSNFWKDINFNFSERSVERIWEIITANTKKLDPEWKNLTYWDAAFLAMFEIKLAKNYNFEWLFDKNSDWLVTAYFLVIYNNNIDDFPFKPFLTHPEKVSFPLRFLVIEKLANYYHYAFELLKSIKDDLIKANQSGNKSFKDTYNSHNPIRLYELFNLKRFYFEKVEIAFKYWSNEGSMAYDDYDHLKSLETKYHLFKNLTNLKNSIDELGSIISL